MATQDQKKIYEGVRSALINNATVAALVSTRVYTSWRPGSASTFPRINLSIISETSLGDNDSIQQFRLQVSCFASERDMGTAANIARAVRDVLTTTSLTFTGWTHYSISREGGRAVGTDNEDIAHWADDYLIFCS